MFVYGVYPFYPLANTTTFLDIFCRRKLCANCICIHLICIEFPTKNPQTVSKWLASSYLSRCVARFQFYVSTAYKPFSDSALKWKRIWQSPLVGIAHSNLHRNSFIILVLIKHCSKQRFQLIVKRYQLMHCLSNIY